MSGRGDNWHARPAAEVLAALAVVTAAQFAFTYAPFLQEWFATRPLSLGKGVLIVSIGVATVLLLEGEKLLLRRLGVEELRGRPARAAGWCFSGRSARLRGRRGR